MRPFSKLCLLMPRKEWSDRGREREREREREKRGTVYTGAQELRGLSL